VGFRLSTAAAWGKIEGRGGKEKTVSPRTESQGKKAKWEKLGGGETNKVIVGTSEKQSAQVEGACRSEGANLSASEEYDTDSQITSPMVK